MASLTVIFIDILVSLAGIVVPATEPVKDFGFCFLHGHGFATSVFL
jgi:hypothetical protein